MATIYPYRRLINDPVTGKRVRSNKAEKDAYSLAWKNHKGRRQSKIFRGTRKDAERFLNKIVADVDSINAGLKMPPERNILFNVAYERYLKNRGTECQENTIERYRKSLKAFQRYFPRDIKLQDIRRREIEEFREKRSDDITPTGVEIDLRHLKAFFNWCYNLEMISKTPFQGVKISRIETPVRFLSHSEIKTLNKAIAESDNTNLKDLVIFYLNSGARANEILPPRFTWNNVGKDRIKLIGKREKIRYIAINPVMREILDRRRNLPYPFPLKYRHVYRTIVEKLFAKAKIENANVHTLRKTTGALLIEMGVDIYRVSKFLGHSSVTVTEKHYVDLLKKDHVDMSNLLATIFKSDTQMICKNGTTSDQTSADLAKSENAINSRKIDLLRREIGVARDGIEPPTQGFSVPCSTD